MPVHHSRPLAGDAPGPCGTCGALPRAHPLLGTVEHHADHCNVLDGSRIRRARDLADLAARPAGWRSIRPLDPSEAGEVADAAGEPAPKGPHRRRWQVAVTMRREGVADVLLRVFRRDGVPVGAIVDEVPARAGAR